MTQLALKNGKAEETPPTVEIPEEISAVFGAAGLDIEDLKETPAGELLRALSDRALALARKGGPQEIGRAQAILEALHKQWPKDAAPVIAMGVCRYSGGDPKGALETFAEADTLDGAADNPDLLVNRGLALSRLGRHDAALADFGAALRVRPQEASVLVMMANALSRLGDCTAADRYYRKALKVRPQDADIHFNRATNLLRRGRYMEAEDTFRLSLCYNNTDADARLCLGLLLVSRRLLSPGLAYMQKATSDKPEDQQNRAIFEAVRRVTPIERPAVAERLLKMYFPPSPGKEAVAWTAGEVPPPSARSAGGSGRRSRRARAASA